MEENIEITIDENGISNPVRAEQKSKKKKPERKNGRKWLVFLILGIVGILGGASLVLVSMILPEEEVLGITFPDIPSKIDEEKSYSLLDGRELLDANLKNAPTYCVQIPNGLDGARPQVGLNHAGVVFEAIAEAGITRFAAVFQNPTTAVIGPIRSLRIYYLDWDTPFGCTIVHAGGSGDALAAVRSGGYRDLTEDYNYMYRGTAGARRWNNLFTTSANLARFNSDHGYQTSDLKGFLRFTPKEAEVNRVEALAGEKLDILEETEANTAEVTVAASDINIRFGYSAIYNVSYHYDVEQNVYLRSYENGEAHEVYDCGEGDLGEINPEGNCRLVQLSPSVVIAMEVKESLASDRYHEDITTTGTGAAYIFQNGTVVRGKWEKSSRSEQIKFLDGDGNEVKLVPGQTFISAVPGYGSIEY